MFNRRSFAKFLSVFAFAVLGLMLVQDAFAAITCRNNTTGERACSNSSCPVGWSQISTACSTRTVGGNITYVTDHGIGIKCTWTEFEGEWLSQPETPISVSHLVGISPFDETTPTGGYATCSGWNSNSVPVGDPNHSLAPFGFGKFLFKIKYTSSNVAACEEDLPNKGIGNNCLKVDAQHPKFNTVPTLGGTRACQNIAGGGTKLTLQFFCREGVGVTGFLTLLPTVLDAQGNSTPQIAPAFTGPPDGCSPERVDAGKCTMVLGGVPTKIVKVKGQNVEVVDNKKCDAIFVAEAVPNALNSQQTQELGISNLLFYEEVAQTGICDANNVPTVQGIATAAYGRYCQSNLGPFSDNLPNPGPNFFATDPAVDGFDNELRICPTANGHTHTAAQDVETVALNAFVNVQFQPTLNLNCTSGQGGNDSGIYKVWIPDQAPLFAANIDVNPLDTDAPKLEGVAPSAAVDVQILVNGVLTPAKELRYPTCPTLSANVIANNPGVTNNSDVFVRLTNGTTNPPPPPAPQNLGLGFDARFQIKVNGL